MTFRTCLHRGGIVLLCLGMPSLTQTAAAQPERASGRTYPLPPVEKASGSPPLSFTGDGGFTVSLYRCLLIRDQARIECYLILTKARSGQSEYTAQEVISSLGGPPRLIDNFKMRYPLERAYFVNRQSREQEKVTLGQNQHVWLGLLYNAFTPEIKSARLVFGENQLEGDIYTVYQ